MSSWMVITGVVAGVVAGAASMWVAVKALSTQQEALDKVAEPLDPLDLADSGGSAYTTKDDGPIHRSEAWWREKGAR
jgi:hypothetical protein